MEEKGSKSTLHDATPSWNGFNYQGKVGLYVALSLICEKLSEGLNLADFDDFKNSYSLEYEWIEDFSIKNNEKYVSLHQVKHYKGSRFSSYKDAVDTVLTRRLGAIAKSDVQNYLSVFQVEKLEENTSKAIDELIACGLLTSELFLTPDWQSKIIKLSLPFQAPISKCLNEHALLHKNAYKSAVPTYLHTCEKISPPTLSLEDYVWSSSKVKAALTDKSLEDHNIFITQRPAMGFEIAIKDEGLNCEIKSLIERIKKIISPGDCGLLSSASYDCYRSALLSEVELHIQHRHKQLNDAEIIDGKYAKIVSPLSFGTLVAVLKSDMRVQDDTYFELLSKLFLENALDLYESKVLDALSDYIEEEESLLFEEWSGYLTMLRHYRNTVLSKLSKAELHTKLQQCLPNYKRVAPLDMYYQKVFSQTDFENVFLKFILSIKSPLKYFHPVCSKSLRYAPSFINIESLPGTPEKIYNRLSLAITNACTTDAFTDSLIYDYHFITIKAKDDGQISRAIQPPMIGEDFINDSPYPIFTEKLTTKLISIDNALKKINE